MLVIFEGPDGVGKDTLRRAFEKATGYEHVTTSRGHLSHLVYAQYFNRDLWKDSAKLQAHIAEWVVMSAYIRPVVVLLTADKATLDHRLRMKHENPSDSPEPLTTMKMFKICAEALRLPGYPGFLEISTSLGNQDSIPQYIERIKGKIETLRKRRVS